jgi:MSHA biogenesis protein MshJ
VNLARLLNAILARFDRLALRERVLVIIAALAVLVGAFHLFVMSSVDVRRRQLSLELAALQSEMDGASKAALAASTADPIAEQSRRAAELKARLAATDAALASQAAGMIPPQRMTQVLHDVLRREQGVKLVSLRYLNTTPLPDEAQGALPPGTPRPYLHTAEIVVQGSYLDILAYLRALEALPWRFYWRRLELTSTRYPTNEVRLEVGTVSMESQWIGL